MTRLWIVRAGKQGERERDALEEGQLYPGFSSWGDLTGLADRDALLARLQVEDTESGTNRLRNFAAQLNQFINTIQIGDLVVMPLKVADGIAVGEVTGAYRYDAATPHRHSRSIRWIKESIPRSAFKQDLLYSFGAFLTVCEVTRNEALRRVQAVLETGQDPGPKTGLPQVAPRAISEIDDTPDASEAFTDIEDLANQQIIALIKSEFAGHGLAQLVAEILRSEGYTTRVSPPGPDGGQDILAAGGSLGLGEDRICVEVKSHDGPANNEVVLKLLGAVHTSGAQTGLLVSIGGVNGPARKLIDDNFFKLRLWQMQDLLKALFRNYDQLSDETRAKLPIKRIWAPMSEGG
ncbi:restriction endonuclease [Hyphomonas sp.]|jgi:restriction system protein|uniref:restriction endonuclease n=1 Tax=Hyphomonas sp. TaxID=87 RepID=UPI0026098EEA|nr:restriction endonuclease [Hyphomonas sp.]MDF1807105.1 restriction endonuclease [Hyphomonas sp.]